MPAKLTTAINKIKTVPNPTNAELIDQFYHYMKSGDKANIYPRIVAT
jgi:hypothetical protein